MSVRLYQYTELERYPVTYIADNDEKKIGAIFFGHVIQSPQSVPWDEIEGVIISAMGWNRTWKKQ